MVNKCIITHDMVITSLLRTVTEIILFPVTSAKSFSIKDTNVIDHTSLDIHTESHCNGNGRITLQAAPLDQSCIFIYCHIFRHRIVLTHHRYRT